MGIKRVTAIVPEELIDSAKLGILAASLVSAVAGLTMLGWLTAAGRRVRS